MIWNVIMISAGCVGRTLTQERHVIVGKGRHDGKRRKEYVVKRFETHIVGTGQSL